jgi:asparagine synthase (glutamine-hydrolysing)
MCGIFFSIGFENLPSSVIDSVAHRGPDGRGWEDFSSPQGPVVMAHRRLAIVDLSQDGHQPMAMNDQRYWVTYNGEIYNYIEIRKELESLGHQFNTKTDTEVLLKSYLQWGSECLHKFNGMFAFVIWDDRNKTFFAARDRFGVKPLYYYRQGNKIAFASEIKQFKHIPGWRNTLNPEMLDEYIHKSRCDNRHETLYQNVCQILPGHFMEKGEIKQWYSLRNRVHLQKLSDLAATEQFRGLFEDAVRLRLRSDVPVGACLSGGLDSTSIVSMIRKIQGPNHPIHTFSSVFPNHTVDESQYIDALAQDKNLRSHKNFPSMEGFLKTVDQILDQQDLPFTGTSVFAQWKTFESAKEQGVVVLLDGQGADESLLGYPGMLNGILFDYLKGFNFKSLYQFFQWQSLYNQHSFPKVLLLALQQRCPNLYGFLIKLRGHEREFKEDPISTILDVSLYYFTNNLQSLLRYEDRDSMTFSRESRLPFLDYRLVEFILSLSIQQKFRNTQTKWILRQAMRDINLDVILDRRDKIGFATPESIWEKALPQNSGGMKKFIFDRWMERQNYV